MLELQENTGLMNIGIYRTSQILLSLVEQLKFLAFTLPLNLDLSKFISSQALDLLILLSLKHMKKFKR